MTTYEPERKQEAAAYAIKNTRYLFENISGRPDKGYFAVTSCGAEVDALRQNSRRWVCVYNPHARNTEREAQIASLTSSK